MADPCICADSLLITETGELCAVPGSRGLREVLFYTSSGAFEKASYPWLARVHLLVVGGGGGGGGTEATTTSEVAAGSGGGGGGAAERLVEVATLGASETVTVGAGGAGGSGAAGSNGGATSFGTLVVAGGGTGGAVGTATGAAFNPAAVSAGGQGTTGTVLYQGGDGEPGLARGEASTNFALGGAGGGSVLFTNWWNNVLLGGFPSGTTSEGQNKGYGGIGAASPSSVTAAQRGLDGSKGLVIVALYA